MKDWWQMGFMAKAATRRTVEAVDSRLSIRQTDAAPFLSQSELVTFAVYRALLAKMMRPTKSSWSLRNEKLYLGVQEARSGASVLRVLGIPSAIQISLGVPAPDCSFSADWELQGRVTDNGVHFEASQLRTLDDKLINGELFEEIRTPCVEALSGPAPDIEVVPGIPSVDWLISTVRTCRSTGRGEGAAE